MGLLTGSYVALVSLSAWRWFGVDSTAKGGRSLPTPAVVGIAPLTQLARFSVPLYGDGRPHLFPKPDAEEVWLCEVVVVGGSLGGTAAAAHAMQSGATTCLIELTPWLGGQISSQGVSAIDESRLMRTSQNFSQSWLQFKSRIQEQQVKLPSWAGGTTERVADLNSCWVGSLCFMPKVGAIAAQQLLEASMRFAPGSRWATSTAFKGAEFDRTGSQITAIHAVQRIPRDRGYVPQGQLWRELPQWYSWSDDTTYDKTPLRLEAPPGKRLIVIDATDTGELVGWANIPHRQGSESVATTGEVHAAEQDNPECTQAFTFPFAIAIHQDQGVSYRYLSQVQPEYNLEEHWRMFSLGTFPMFSGRSFFNYRRMVSRVKGSSDESTPVQGDITLVNWNPGNDWNWMDPPLILTRDRLAQSKQYRNWMGGISMSALRHGANHALLFSRWLLETQAQPQFPLAHLKGADSPMGTQSGLSIMPYIREGRRILGRPAYGQEAFMVREADMRRDLPSGRNFNATAIGVAHYDVDIHGCRYRNWLPSWEASSAPTLEYNVRPTQIPLEALIPQEVDNLLIGGKAIAVTHIVNAMTRIHYNEWSVGAAAGATAGWLITQTGDPLAPAEIIPQQQMPQLQQHLRQQGLQINW
ncbi:MAG: FAD-dependent oxidoreductase [Synechococcales bacterium]|nr:FAD-dependent oxidoreductase [Synechococcales bacterium]